MALRWQDADQGGHTPDAVTLHWQQPHTGLPEWVVLRGEAEVGRIRVDGPHYWATPSGNRQPVLFLDRDRAAAWLGAW